MIYTKPIEFPGIDYIISDIEMYKEQFKNDGILVFRNANLDYDHQLMLQIKMGDYLGWSPNSRHGLHSRYDENHSSLADTGISGDTLILGWHVEHPYYTNPIIAGVWNMHVFNTDPDNGKTYFYDTSKLYDRLPLEWQQFLSRCVVNAYSYSMDKMFSSTAVALHWLTGKPTIRIPLTGLKEGFNDLKLYDDKNPSQQENEMYLKIANAIADMVNDDEEFRIVHKWNQGDIVIPDLFRMAHAVTGGFDSRDRIFTGLWSHLKNTTDFPSI